MKKILLLVLCSVMLLSASTNSYANEQKDDNGVPFYVGVRAGLPFGFSTFTSFGDPFQIGFNGGLFGGYYFNHVLSLELSGTWGNFGTSTVNDEPYWLGSDGNQYFAAVYGQDGGYYTDIYSRVFVQQYGLHLNINLLGFAESTRGGDWILNLSPAIYGIGTTASVKTKSDKEVFFKDSSNWGFGVGADIILERFVTENLFVGVYAGATYLTSTGIDGIPVYDEVPNFLAEAGIRVGWAFGRPSDSEDEEEEVVEEVVEEEVVEEEVVEKDYMLFPSIYFGHNIVLVDDSQDHKIDYIANVLKSNPNVNVVIIGNGDNTGTKEANFRVSRKRADNVKADLVERGIAEDRISKIGSGIDYEAESDAEARRATTIKIQ